MIRHLWRLSLIAALMAPCASAPAMAAVEQAGVAAAVRGEVQLVSLADPVGHQVASGEAIFLGNEISSGHESGLQILLMDETVFTIGPNSSLTIDEFVYDPVTSIGKVTASVARGTFRFISGKVAGRSPRDMTVKLPNGVIGIRGTIAGGRVTGAGGEIESVVVLLGPGARNNAGERVGQIVVRGVQARAANPYIQKAAVGAGDANVAADLAQAVPGGGAGPEVVITRPGWGTTISGFLPPTDPAPVPPDVIDQMTSDLKSGAAPPKKGAPKGEMKAGAATKSAGQDTAEAIDTSTDTSGFADDDIKNTDLVTEIPTDPRGGGGWHPTTREEVGQLTGTAFYSISSAPFHQFLGGCAPCNGTFDAQIEVDFGANKWGGPGSSIQITVPGGISGGPGFTSIALDNISEPDEPVVDYALDSGEVSNDAFVGTYIGLDTGNGVIAANWWLDIHYDDTFGNEGYGDGDSLPNPIFHH